MGFDPGFANLGVTILDVYPAPMKPAVVACQVVETKKANTKRGIRQYDDDTRRLEEILLAWTNLLATHQPDLVAGERLPSLRSAKVTRQLATVFGGIFALSRSRDLQVVLFDPEEIKWGIAQDRTASKDDVFEALKHKLQPYKDWPATKKVEHVADAGSAAYLAGQTPLAQVLLQARNHRAQTVV